MYLLKLNMNGIVKTVKKITGSIATATLLSLSPKSTSVNIA